MGHDVPGADLFVVCKQCGSEVSPYITECPYCGHRLRRRAPKLPRANGRDRAAAARARWAPCTSGAAHGRRAQRVSRSARAYPRTDRAPYATIALVAAGCAGWVAVRGGYVELRQARRSSVHCTATGGSCCRASSSTCNGVCMRSCALLATAIFGWLLERRHGRWSCSSLFFGAASRGALAASAVYSAPIVSGANGAALALLVAWAAPDLQAARAGDYYEGDLLGAGAIAATLLLAALRPSRRRAGWPAWWARSSALIARLSACILIDAAPSSEAQGGAPVSWSVPRDADPPNRHRSSDDDMEIRFLGHAAFELSDGATSVLIDPFLTGNPRRPCAADELEPEAILLTHGQPTTSATPCRSPSAPSGRRGDRGDRERALRGRRREGPRPQPRWHGHARLGLGQARARLAHLDDPKGHGQHAGRADRELRGQDDLPPRRHGAVLGPGADLRARGDDRRGADVHRRALHDGSPRRGRGRQADRRQAGDPVPLRHVPADRDRRAGVQGRGRGGRRLEVVVLAPGESHSP